MRPTLHRHQLVRLREGGWKRILGQDWPSDVRDCLAHWATRGLPLVITRQPVDLQEGTIAVGLAAPSQWELRRFSLRIAESDILYFDEFPSPESVGGQLAEAMREAWREVCLALKAAGVRARVYGSHGWQNLSGLRYVHRNSDIDLWMCVGGLRHADRAIEVLQGFERIQPLRIDGELQFPDGKAYAWREWAAWRQGRCHRMLTKTLHGPAMGFGSGMDSMLCDEAVT